MHLPISAAVTAALFAMFGLLSLRADPPVVIDVRFKLTDLDYKPIPQETVRLVLGSQAGWQKADAGRRFTTDASGGHRFETHSVLEMRRRKMPTNYLSSLVSLPQPTDCLQVAAEFEYAGHRWLYVVTLCRFRSDGTVMNDRLDVYSPDAQGNFTNRARYNDQGWKIADLNGLVLTHPGYALSNFMLQPGPADSTHQCWTLDLAFRKSPPPVRR